MKTKSMGTQLAMTLALVFIMISGAWGQQSTSAVPAVAAPAATVPVMPDNPAVPGVSSNSTAMAPAPVVGSSTTTTVATTTVVSSNTATEVTTEVTEAKSLVLTTNSVDRNLISIQVEHAPLSEIVRAFTQLSGANIIMGTNGHELVTVSMKNVEWEPALNAILDSAGKTLMQKSPGIYMIGSKADASGEPVTVDTINLKYVTAEAIMPSIAKMLVGTNTSVSAIPASNVLILKAPPSNLADIRKTITAIDQPRDQVFIEAKFVELNDEAIKDIGVNWTSLQGVTLSATSIVASLSRTVTKDNAQNSINQQQNVNAGQSFLNSNGQPSSSLQGPSTVSTLPAGKGSVTTTAPTISGTNGSVIQNVLLSGMNNNLGVDTLDSSLRSAVLSASDFSVIISALKQNIGATIVSNPRLLVASGENAVIHVGENVPYAANSTIQQGTGGNSTQSTVAMIKVGVQLEVTPVVNSENSVTLKIKPEISSVSSTVLIDGNPVPVVTTRDVTTLFNVESGRTVCIGGLVTDNNQTTETKIPLLGDIPIIGKYLFSHSHADRAKSEVIIFVTVTTIKAERIKTLDGYPTTSRLIHKFTHNEELEALEEQRVREEEAKHLEQLKKTQNQPATNAVKGRASLFD